MSASFFATSFYGVSDAAHLKRLQRSLEARVVALEMVGGHFELERLLVEKFLLARDGGRLDACEVDFVEVEGRLVLGRDVGDDSA